MPRHTRVCDADAAYQHCKQWHRNKSELDRVVQRFMICAVCLVTVLPLSGRAEAQTETPIYSFQGGADGEAPYQPLFYSNGVLYGSTNAPQSGTIFSVTPSGHEKVLYSFTCTGEDCGPPSSNLVGIGTTLYGTNVGNSSAYGYVFSITSSGTEATLHAFADTKTDGAYPTGLIQINGTLYGVTAYGGGGPHGGSGTIYSLAPDGTFSLIHAFAAKKKGLRPNDNLLPLNKVLYGTTVDGGAAGDGSVFSVKMSGGQYRTLYSFQGGADGVSPQGGLINVNGILYGVTSFGIHNGAGTIYSITPAGDHTVLHNFGTGVCALAPLVYANGLFYGTTLNDGLQGQGTIFSMTPSGTYTVLHEFTGYPNDGARPLAGMINVSGVFYGTTTAGGSGAGSGGGTVFSFTP
jgi:uncharacterized repeat protein (TIGR03803 family)